MPLISGVRQNHPLEKKGVYLKVLFEMIKTHWGELIAFAALILSQLPSVRQMIKGKRLRMAVAGTAQFSHVFGNTNISLWLDLENDGGKTISVRRISCFLRQVSGEVQSITATHYWLTESLGHEKPIELPLGELALKPGERWSGYLHCWNTQTWGKAIESKVKSLMIKIRDDIDRKVAERDKNMQSLPAAERPFVEVDSTLVQDTLDIVKNLRKLEEAEYVLLVVAFESANRPLKVLGFDLTLFESDIRDIFEDVEDYKYGFGVGLPTRKAKYVQVQIRSKGQKESEELFSKIRRASLD